MFKKKEELDYAKVDTIIGKETFFNGQFNGKGILRIDGKIIGEINQSGDIIVGETGVVEANIKARHITVSGVVKGNIEASGLLQLLTTAKVYGDIKIHKLSIDDGAIFKGCCEMIREEKTIEKEESKKVG
ncbi:bactofilin family protein [Anaerobranca gottschalkii]|uniref:Protein CcmA, bactofilin family n=1 Tax=Anaerobranca gottschalkii DSM 13577 TaxID=1120990 RepID=A0A1I0BT90_9FIRM|nr:polymer-forming cytoskeletal protein [Anaerobranca gottschalkii]SET10289.1 protein CcmA, bactofilin family [Anaerobranca gottschalkii DSM 13577]